MLLITYLPKYDEYADCYTEEEVANLLIPFGFQYLDENIYVSPQMRMVGTRFINALHIQTFDKFSQESFHIWSKPYDLAEITWSSYFLYDYQSLTLFWKNFGTLLFTTLILFIEISFMHSSLRVPPQHFDPIKVWALALSLQYRLFFSLLLPVKSL